MTNPPFARSGSLLSAPIRQQFQPLSATNPMNEIETDEPESYSADAIVLKVGQTSFRVRMIGEEGQVTLRISPAGVVPGHIVSLAVTKRWEWNNYDYATGSIEGTTIDAQRLGLERLELSGGYPMDLREIYPPYEEPDPYASLWRTLTEEARPCFEMDPIAWGDFGDNIESNPTLMASELRRNGDHEGADEVLMEALLTDLRFVDGHAQLGRATAEHLPKNALAHFEVGVRIGELSLPQEFDGILMWEGMYNRPFLRCLYGYGDMLWKLERLQEAEDAFLRLLTLCPNDNIGARFAWDAIRKGRAWSPD